GGLAVGTGNEDDSQAYGRMNEESCRNGPARRPRVSNLSRGHVLVDWTIDQNGRSAAIERIADEIVTLGVSAAQCDEQGFRSDETRVVLDVLDRDFCVPRNRCSWHDRREFGQRACHCDRPIIRSASSLSRRW